MKSLKIRTTLQPLQGSIDITPLVDVVLLLLIFFILSSSFVLQPGIEVKVPRQGIGSGIRNTRFIVTVTSRDPAMIFFNDSLTDLNRLKGEFAELVAEEGEATIVIKADRAVPHGTVVNIMNDALKVGLEVIVATSDGEEQDSPARVESP